VGVRQARFDADPNKLKGKVPRPSAKKYRRQDEGNSDDDFEDMDEDDEDDGEDFDSGGEGEENDEEQNAGQGAKGKLALHERAHQRKAPAAEAREANNTRLPIKLASGRIVQPTAKLEKQGQCENILLWFFACVWDLIESSSSLCGRGGGGRRGDWKKTG